MDTVQSLIYAMRVTIDLVGTGVQHRRRRRHMVAGVLTMMMIVEKIEITMIRIVSLGMMNLGAGRDLRIFLKINGGNPGVMSLCTTNTIPILRLYTLHTRLVTKEQLEGGEGTATDRIQVIRMHRHP